jgi:hypothetical protein
MSVSWFPSGTRDGEFFPPGAGDDNHSIIFVISGGLASVVNFSLLVSITIEWVPIPSQRALVNLGYPEPSPAFPQAVNYMYANFPSLRLMSTQGRRGFVAGLEAESENGYIPYEKFATLVDIAASAIPNLNSFSESATVASCGISRLTLSNPQEEVKTEVVKPNEIKPSVWFQRAYDSLSVAGFTVTRPATFIPGSFIARYVVPGGIQNLSMVVDVTDDRWGMIDIQPASTLDKLVFNIITSFALCRDLQVFNVSNVVIDSLVHTVGEFRVQRLEGRFTFPGNVIPSLPLTVHSERAEDLSGREDSFLRR